MQILKVEKVAAAAVAAVLSFTVVAKAGTYSDPSIEASYTQQDTAPYATGSFTGGPPTGTLSLPGAGSGSDPLYADFANTGAFPTFGTHVGPLTTVAPGAGGGELLTISFTMDTSITGSNPLDPYVGLQVVDTSNNIVGGLFSQYGAGGSANFAGTDGSNGEVNAPGYHTAPSGTAYTYTLTLDPSNNSYFATSYLGGTYTGEMSNIPGDTNFNNIAFVSFGGIDQGIAGSAQYSNFTVTTSTPEPASIAMMGLGALMLFVKRPKRSA